MRNRNGLFFGLLLIGFICFHLVNYYLFLFFSQNSFSSDYAFLQFIYTFGHNYIFIILNEQLQDKIMLWIVIPLISTSIIFSVLSLVALLMVVLVCRTISQRNKKVNMAIAEQCEDAIINYLFDDKEIAIKTLQSLKSKNKVKILLIKLVELHKTLIGKQAEDLNTLFYLLQLDQLTIKKLKSHKWYTQLRYIQITSEFKVKSAIDIIKKNLENSNEFIRTESQIANIIIEEQDPFNFLSVLKTPLTEWEQFNIYDLIIRKSIPVPLFKQYLFSPNQSVIIFSLRMIRFFHQADAYDAIILMLKNSNVQIRRQAIKALAVLNNKKSVDTLKKIFSHENNDNKILIIQVIGQIAAAEEIEFYKKIVKDHHYDIFLAGIKALFLYDFESVENYLKEHLLNEKNTFKASVIKQILNITE